MASEDKLRPVVDDDTVLLDANERPLDANERSETEEITPAGEWPVADLYYVTPDEANEPSEPAAAAEPTVVATSVPQATTRRFAPGTGVGAAIAMLGILAAVVVGAVLLGADGDDPSAAPRAATEESPPAVETTPPPSNTAKVEVVRVEGTTLPQAKRALAAQDLRVRVTRAPSERPRGEVVSQAPSAESSVPTGTVVALVVSEGRDTTPTLADVEVPGLVGRSSSDAVSALREARLKARVRQVTSSERRGTVVDQVPAEGTRVVEGSTVALEVAKPPKRPPVVRVAVPDVVGSSVATARAELRAAGFTVSTVTVASDEPAGAVIEQAPRAGTELREGERVRLTVSAGPADVDVPDVTGLDEASATRELERAGFQVRVIDESTADPAQDGIVVRQAPAGGSSAEDGASVTITVGRLD
jgi:eukaryotic-like serine/threonine-protein kinase